MSDTADTGTATTDGTATADVSAADQPTDGTDTSTDTSTDTGTPDGADALGDAGKRALDAMKGKWRDERDKRRAAEERLAALEAASAGSGDTTDPDAIRAEATREATAKANARLVRAELKAAATGKMADPTDVLVYLDPAQFEVSEDGEVDATELADAIDELLTKKPHLAAATRPRFQGSGDGGAARTPAGPTQLTREALQNMSPDEIVKAKREGRLKNILSGN